MGSLLVVNYGARPGSGQPVWPGSRNGDYAVAKLEAARRTFPVAASYSFTTMC